MWVFCGLLASSVISTVLPLCFWVCLLSVVFPVGFLGWVGCSVGTLGFCNGYILWFAMGYFFLLFSLLRCLFRTLGPNMNTLTLFPSVLDTATLL